MMKFTLYTAKSKENNLLFNLHKFGKVQIDKMTLEDELYKDFFKDGVTSLNSSKIYDNISNINYLINTLTPFEDKVSIIEKYREGKPYLDYTELSKIGEKFDINKIYDEVKFEDEALKDISSQILTLNQQNEDLDRYSNFDMDERELKKFKYYEGTIGLLPTRNFDKCIQDLNEKELIFYTEEIGNIKEDKLVFIVYIKEFKNEVEEILRNNGFSKSNNQIHGVPKNLVQSNLLKIESLTNNKKQHTEKLKSLTPNLPILRKCYDYYENEKSKEEIKTNLLNSDKFFVLLGWVASDDSKALMKLLDETLGDDYFIDMEEASKDDENVPVLLKNNLLNSSFESITQMYSCPRYNEIDPTPFITPFYLVFFGMMLADVGYGLLLLIASSIALKFFKLEKTQKNFMRFFFFLSFPTIIAGLVYGSFFGDAIKIPALIDTSKDIMTLLAISVILGVIQIFFGLGVKAYMYIRDGKLLDAVFDVFTWYAALIGAIGLLLTSMSDILPKSMGSVFTAIMVIGMVGIVLTNGRQNKTIVGKLVGGLYALYNISGYVGDFVSYSRIMALGLAGGFIAFAFNMIIGMMPVFARFTIGIAIFIFAHLFNLFLSALGAYVHTCRLQYVEYFGKFYEGGGKPFKPFKSSNKYIEITEINDK